MSKSPEIGSRTRTRAIMEVRDPNKKEFRPEFPY